ncbi:MAG: ROK family protein [Ruminococcaceae bacterium]|nr:ROK family protein [Oscillospiraceae bacterium]
MLYLGIDCGGSNIAAAIVDESMNIVGRGKVKFAPGRSAECFCDDIAAAARMAADDAGVQLSDCAYCGLGCPGVVNSGSGMLEYSANLGIENLSLGAEMERRLGLSIYIANDANCAALGEVKAGAAKGADSALVVTLGTGIGGGIVIGGRIYAGVNGIAGEIGHMVIFPGGEECSCGRRGCWEAYASATALKRQTRRAMEAAPDSLMWKYAPSLDKVSGKTPFVAQRAGDATAALVVDSYINYLALGLVNVINILQPEVVCIGGGVSNEGDPLLLPLRERVESMRFVRGNLRHPRIELATLWGDAGLIGAAMLDA